MKYLPDAIGVLVVGVLSFLVCQYAFEGADRWKTWVPGVIFLGAAGMYAWRSERAPRTAADGLYAAAGSIVVGAIFLAIDVGIGKFFHRDLSYLQAAMTVRSPFGFALTVIACPIGTILSLGGAARVWVRHALVGNLG